MQWLFYKQSQQIVCSVVFYILYINYIFICLPVGIPLRRTIRITHNNNNNNGGRRGGITVITRGNGNSSGGSSGGSGNSGGKRVPKLESCFSDATGFHHYLNYKNFVQEYSMLYLHSFQYGFI